jgi:chromosome segregation ATPase
VRIGSKRRLAAAGIAVTGIAAGAAAYLLVGDLPGVLYAAGIALAAFVGAAAIVAGERRPEPETSASTRPPRWRRKSHIIAELELDLASTVAELEEHRQALANLAAQLTRESEAARGNAERLEQRIRELTAERDGLQELLAQEREVFEETLVELGGGLGRHGDELARLERELEALITG